MNRFKIVVMTLVAVLVMALNVDAQVKKGGQQAAHKRAQVLKTELVLSDAQTTQVEQILTTFIQSARPAKKGDAKVDRKAAAEKRDAEFKKVLTADQWNKLVAFRAKGKGGKK